MLYNCPNGSVLNMSTEYYFAISDRELEEMCSCSEGCEINDPFYESTIAKTDSALNPDEELFEERD